MSPPAGWTYAPYTGSDRMVSRYWADRYEREAAKNWDLFYRRHADRFFKDRHYLAAEWPVLDAAAKDEDTPSAAPQLEDDLSEIQRAVSGLIDGGPACSRITSATMDDDELLLLEAGCGVGNTIFPLLRANARLRCYGVDFAEAAVAIVQRHELAQSGRACAAVGDLTKGELPPELAPCLGRCDVATLMFVLSAISPERMAPAVDAAASALRDGGLLLVRDYADGDGAQRRLASGGGRPKQLDTAGRFFVRQDGTRAYYFEPQELQALVESRGFETHRCDVVLRTTTNRAKGLTIQRRYVVGTFRRCVHPAAAPGPPQPLPSSTASLLPASPPSPPLLAPLTTQPSPSVRRPSPGVADGAVPLESQQSARVAEAKSAVLAALDTALGPNASLEERRTLLVQLLASESL